jgi:imidazolonepropionase-like amidohydrolase
MKTGIASSRRAVPLLWSAVLLATSPLVCGVDLLPPGHRPVPPGTHALVGGKVVVKPGEVLDGGTLIIRDGRIAAVGKDIASPADARVWDMKGLTIYAGFIDTYLTLGTNVSTVSTTLVEPIEEHTSGINFFGVPGQERDPGNPGPGYELSKIIPEQRAAQNYAPSSRTLEGLRELGFTAGNLTPTRGILRGTSAFIQLADVNPNVAILKADVFHHVALETGGFRPAEEGQPRTPSGFPGSLMGVIAAVRQSFFDAEHYQRDKADYQKRPAERSRPAFNPALEALKPALEQRMPVVFEPGSALMVDRAARVARELGLKFLICASGQEWRRPDLAKAVGGTFIVPLNFPAAPRMPEDDDWSAVSLDQLRAWDWSPENAAVLRQQGVEIALTTHGLAQRTSFRRNLQQAMDRGLNETDALAALTTVPAKLCGLDSQLGTIEKGKIANLTVVEGASYFDAEAKVREVWIDGRVLPTSAAAARFGKGPAAKVEKKAAPSAENGKAKTDDGKKGAGGKRAAELRDLQKKRLAHTALDGRGALASPRSILVKNATIWTSGASGILTNASLLISDGKIQNVGSFKAELSADTLVIDGTGQHVTAGLIDCHSHSMILGGVNEGSIPSSAMVRIADVVNSETANIHQQLAGGLTAANLLHGSANPIGGQNCVIKLKDGAAPEELKIPDAPPGIKFALGENVKQSSASTPSSRYPQTRMGVPTFMANRFIAAQQYLKEWEEFKQRGGAPPRRDLELEAIGEIIQGKRLVHCHSYRQDEILAFLRTMESFGVRVATLQHILEGYKVADEMVRHGAAGSTFSDWWAYKFEVYDAIAYNGSLMRDRGVLVSFNSDSSDLARRLYLEAAKAVKYGNTSEEEALKFVTFNPAKQLRIDHRIGSLEQGKDADFVIWSKSPLDSATVCEQTWIEGKKYFDRSVVPARTEALAKERSELLAKVKRVVALSGTGGGGGGGGDGADPAGALFFLPALETMQSHVVGCEDCNEGGRH